MIIYEDFIFIFYIWIPNTTIDGAMKKNSNSNTLLLLLYIWPKNIMSFITYQSFFSVYSTMLASQYPKAWTLIDPKTNPLFWPKSNPRTSLQRCTRLKYKNCRVYFGFNLFTLHPNNKSMPIYNAKMCWNPLQVPLKVKQAFHGYFSYTRCLYLSSVWLGMDVRSH